MADVSQGESIRKSKQGRTFHGSGRRIVIIAKIDAGDRIIMECLCISARESVFVWIELSRETGGGNSDGEALLPVGHEVETPVKSY